jgi:dethiobiotin synthetase
MIGDHWANQTMLSAVSIPGLLITGTDTGVGKTVIAGAIAHSLRRQQHRIGVLKPVATGCVRRREGLVSEDAEFLAHCADTPFPLDVICPQRYAEPLAPAVAADRASQPLDWDAVQRSLDMICRGSDLLIVEGVGGVMVPLDAKHTCLDMATWLGLPVIIVARAGLGTINHALLTARVLKAAGVKVAGVVINRYTAEHPSVAEETNPRIIERWSKLPVLCIVPEVRAGIGLNLPADLTTPIDAVDWLRLSRRRD